MRFSWLDFKLGLRMLARYPGITIVACLAIGVAIGLGSVYFEATQKVLNPSIPLDEGDRVIAVQNWETLAAPEDPFALHELAMGRTDLRSIAELGAAMRFQRNLVTPDGRMEAVRGAEITASAFQLARVKPLLGRPLLPSDEDVNAAPAAVIGYSLWQSQFDGNAGAVGGTVKLGSINATVVGVMPEGFAFPFAEQIWTTMRLTPAQLGTFRKSNAGPGRPNLIGRLGPGVSLADAQAELDLMAARLGPDSPEALRQAGPRVIPLGQSFLGPTPPMEFTILLYSIHIVVVLLLAIICTSVATLVFARTTARAWEIMVRSALGAGRWRIVSQLFVEALVLAGVGAFIGIAAAAGFMRFFFSRLVGSGAPFWFLVSDMSPWTMAYAALLTLIGASIIGILPGLRFTRHDLHLALQREGSAKSGLRFGGFWTAVITVQLAITVALIPIAVGGASLSNRFERRAKALNAEKYLAATFNLEPEVPARDSSEAAAFVARSKATYQAIQDRLLADPEVEAVAFANRLPGMDQFKYGIAVDTQTSASAIRGVTSSSVSAGFFDAFGAPVLAGRGFNAGDELQKSVIVNQSFVRHVLEGRNAIGQRLRFPRGREGTVNPDEWYEIVGVTQDLGSHATEESPVEASAVYFPTTAGNTTRVQMAVRVRGTTGAVAQRLRAIAVEIDPTLRINNLVPLSRVNDGEAQINWVLTSVVSAVSLMTLLLSAMGIHALMAFTVARRTREIGIRTALGAQPHRIAAEIFSRAFLQLALGILVGVGLAMLFDAINSDFIIDAGLLLTAAGAMLTAGLVACAAPLRRALRIDPTEALRREG